MTSHPPLLTEQECQRALSSLPGWQLEEGGKALRCRYVFKGFRAAFAFMTEVAKKAEVLRHHPEWTNIYNRVDVRLTTHDAGGITALDIELARAMNLFAP